MKWYYSQTPEQVLSSHEDILSQLHFWLLGQIVEKLSNLPYLVWSSPIDRDILEHEKTQRRFLGSSENYLRLSSLAPNIFQA